MNTSRMDEVNFWPDPGRRPRRVLAAMSGGVDSTFAAYWLKKAGAEVIGLHFKMGDFADPEDGVLRCCSLAEARDARRVADQLGIPFYVVSAKEAFAESVIRPFIESYAQGLTPNPCVLCNPRIKWRFLVQKARELSADAVATGHHARSFRDPATGRAILLQGVDRKKDQSYFLFGLSREQLELAVLPAGWFVKNMARKALKEAGFKIYAKTESQDICFTGPGGYPAFVEERLAERKPPAGEIVDREGKVLGRHPGIHHFTVGQRKGLAVAGPTPLYVIGIDAERDRVIVGPWPETYFQSAVIGKLNWLADPPSPEEEVQVKVRYKSPFAISRVIVAGPETAKIVFEQPQRAIAAGQAAVIYRGPQVLGGGIFQPSPLPSPQVETMSREFSEEKGVRP